MRMFKRNPAILAVCSLLLLSTVVGCHGSVCKPNGSGGNGDTCNGARAVADTATTPQDTAKLIDVLANDTDSSGGTSGTEGFAIESVVSPTTQGGTAVISGNQILYTPPPVPTGGPTTTDVKNISTGINDATGAKHADDVLDTDYIIASGGTGGRVGDVPRTERNSLPPGYITDGASTSSAWLALSGGDVNGSAVPPGTYFWEVKVDAAGFDPTTMQISGLRVAFDNELDAVYVNNVLVVPSPPTANPSFSFVTLGDVGLGAFQSGVNTIRFVVRNTGDVDTDMTLRVEGVVQATTAVGPTAPFTDTFTYRVNDACGTTSARATVRVNVTAPNGTLAARALSPARILIVNNSSDEITVSVGGAEVDVVQPRGTTVAPRRVAAGANEEIRVDALGATPQANSSTSVTADLEPDGAYTITYSDTGTGTPTIKVTE